MLKIAYHQKRSENYKTLQLEYYWEKVGEGWNLNWYVQRSESQQFLSSTQPVQRLRVGTGPGRKLGKAAPFLYGQWPAPKKHKRRVRRGGEILRNIFQIDNSGSRQRYYLWHNNRRNFIAKLGGQQQHKRTKQVEQNDRHDEEKVFQVILMRNSEYLSFPRL